MARVLICEPHDDISALLELVVRRLGLRSRNVPVLFTSIYPPDAAVLDLEPAAYLVKPFPLYALERALEAALAVTGLTPAVAAV